VIFSVFAYEGGFPTFDCPNFEQNGHPSAADVHTVCRVDLESYQAIKFDSVTHREERMFSEVD